MDCAYISHGNARGLCYLLEATANCKNGIIIGVDVYAANEKEVFWFCEIWSDNRRSIARK
jgi:hypothetical protein